MLPTRPRRTALLLPALAAASLLAACAADPDSSGPERTGGGGGSTDTGRVDTGADTGESDDTGLGDTDPADTGEGDTGLEDTDPTDTSLADSGDDTTADTGSDAFVDPDATVERIDSDGDGIWDGLEGDRDPDGDGRPNYLDDDSDGDGLLDRWEYRRPADSGTRPSDIDTDGAPDFVDRDSDGDGLLDQDEDGCPGSSLPTETDSDRDGYPDVVEVAFGSDACDRASDISTLVDFFFTLPFEGPPERAELPIGTSVEKGDVVFNMDVTGSMSASIASLQSSLRTSIIPGLASRISNVGIGVSAFADFPCDGYGNAGDYPFKLLQRVTTDAAAAQRGTSLLRLAGGGDTPESGWESLYQLATGLGRADEGCSGSSTRPFDPSAGLVAGVSDGTIGGAGFRDSQVRVIVHITDATSHIRDVRDVPSDPAPFPYGANDAEVRTALGGIDAKVIGVAVTTLGRSEATPSLTTLAQNTGAVVPACAWGTTDRPAGCGPTQCCTGPSGRGESPVGGLCPLVFKPGTAALNSSVISGIEALLGGSAFDITAVPRRDEAEFTASGIDTTCFLQSITPRTATASGCASAPLAADTDGDGTLDGFTGVSPGASVTFELETRNLCVDQIADPQTFLFYIDLITSEGDSLGTKLVTVLVPPLGDKQ